MRRLAVPALALCLLLAACNSAPPAPPARSSAPGPPHSASQASTAPSAARSSTPATSPPGTAKGNCAGTPSQQYLTRDVLTAIQFVSPAVGWAVGQRQILATTNGGQSWAVQERGRLDLVSVDFISSQVGWAVGLSSLLVTHDGGRHWASLPDPCPVIRSVHFLTVQVGYAIAGGSGLLADGTLAPATGGILLVTGDGGQSWQRLPSPASPQSVCFASRGAGWLGADGNLYRSAENGRIWRLAAAWPGPKAAQYPSTMFVQCAGPDSVWAVDIGAGAAMSQQPHLGYHGDQAGATPIFAEQFFPHPGVTVKAESPSSYAGPLTAISPSTAAFADWCPVCSALGTVQWDLATDSGSTLTREGAVPGINQPIAASFMNPQLGWIAGIEFRGEAMIPRIVSTQNGGLSWQVQWTG